MLYQLFFLHRSLSLSIWILSHLHLKCTPKSLWLISYPCFLNMPHQFSLSSDSGFSFLMPPDLKHLLILNKHLVRDWHLHLVSCFLYLKISVPPLSLILIHPGPTTHSVPTINSRAPTFYHMDFYCTVMMEVAGCSETSTNFY
jgi:hypothetical protein